MKSPALLVVHGVILLMVAPLFVALLTPSTDLLTMGLFWLAAVVLVELGFFLRLWLTRKGKT